MRDGGDAIRAIGDNFRIGHAAKKAGEAGHFAGGASRKERGIPNGSEQPQSFAARNEKAEASQRASGVLAPGVPEFDLIEAIARGYLGDTCIFNPRQQRRESAIKAAHEPRRGENYGRHHAEAQ